MKEDKLLDWLVEAHSAESCMDAIDKEHSTTYQTPEYWIEKSRIQEQAYQQIVALIKKPKVITLRHSTSYGKVSELIKRIKDAGINKVEIIKKPEVTEELIEEKARELNNLILHFIDSRKTMGHDEGVKKAKDFIRSIVEEMRK